MILQSLLQLRLTGRHNHKMKKNILLIGSDSKIAQQFIFRYDQYYNIYKTSRRVSKNDVKYLKLDLSNKESVDSLIQYLSNLNFHGVISFASTYNHQTLPNIDTIKMDLQVNFLSIYKIVRSIQLANISKIILISDSALYQPKKDFFGYTVSKKLLNLYTRQLAVDLSPNTSVNLISLGPILTNKTGEDKKRYFEKSIIKVAEPQIGLVNLINFIFSEDNFFMTGSEIIYDGGRRLKRVT